MVGAIGEFRAVALLLCPCSDAKSGGTAMRALLRLGIRIWGVIRSSPRVRRRA